MKEPDELFVPPDSDKTKAGNKYNPLAGALFGAAGGLAYGLAQKYGWPKAIAITLLIVIIVVGLLAHFAPELLEPAPEPWKH